MPSEDSLDPCCVLDRRLIEVSELFMDGPTLPADEHNPAMPCAEALREDGAIQLPTKYCAYKNCAWHGNADSALMQHSADVHTDVLETAIYLFYVRL